MIMVSDCTCFLLQPKLMLETIRIGGGGAMWGVHDKCSHLLLSIQDKNTKNIEYIMGTSYLLLFRLKAFKFFKVCEQCMRELIIFHSQSNCSSSAPPSLVAIFPCCMEVS